MIAVAVETDFVGLVQARLRRRAAVTRVAFASVAGDRDELAAGQIDAQHPMIPDFGHVQRSVGTDLDAKRLADVDLAGAALAAVVRRIAGSSHGLDDLRLGEAERSHAKGGHQQADDRRRS